MWLPRAGKPPKIIVDNFRYSNTCMAVGRQRIYLSCFPTYRNDPWRWRPLWVCLALQPFGWLGALPFNAERDDQMSHGWQSQAALLPLCHLTAIVGTEGVLKKGSCLTISASGDRYEACSTPTSSS
jgi:hypothetical protein